VTTRPPFNIYDSLRSSQLNPLKWVSFSKVHESFEAPPEGTEDRYMRPKKTKKKWKRK